MAPEKFGITVRDSPKYSVIDELNSSAEPDGIVPSHAKLVANSEMLLGPTRFIMDDLLTQDQCDMLITLARKGKIGDGYDGDDRPHSEGETFRGIGILEAAKLAQTGQITVEAVKLYDFIEHEMAKIVADYFELDQPLYPDFIHLVCREPLDQETHDEDGNLILR